MIVVTKKTMVLKISVRHSGAFEGYFEDALDQRGVEWEYGGDSSDIVVVEGDPRGNRLSRVENDLLRYQSKSLIAFSVPLQLSFRSRNLGNHNLRTMDDKATLSQMFANVPGIPKTWNAKSSEIVRVYERIRTKYPVLILKPSMYSDRQEGVGVVRSVQDIERWLASHSKFPLWILQEFVESSTPYPHYFKANVIILSTGEAIEWYVNDGATYSGVHEKGNVTSIPLLMSEALALKKSGKVLVGASGNAERIFDRHFGRGYFKTRILKQIKTTVAGIAGKMELPNLCHSGNKVCFSIMSFDFIMAKRPMLLEINTNPFHKVSCYNTKPSTIHARRVLSSPLYKSLSDWDPCSKFNSAFLAELLDDLLKISLDPLLGLPYKPLTHMMLVAKRNLK